MYHPHYSFIFLYSPFMHYLYLSYFINISFMLIHLTPIYYYLLITNHPYPIIIYHLNMNSCTSVLLDPQMHCLSTQINSSPNSLLSDPFYPFLPTFLELHLAPINYSNSLNYLPLLLLYSFSIYLYLFFVFLLNILCLISSTVIFYI